MAPTVFPACQLEAYQRLRGRSDESFRRLFAVGEACELRQIALRCRATRKRPVVFFGSSSVGEAGAPVSMLHVYGIVQESGFA